jgi:hypothetical protein
MRYYLRLKTYNPAYPGYYFWTNGGWSKKHPIIFFNDEVRALNKLSTEQASIIESSWKVTMESWDERDETFPSLVNDGVAIGDSELQEDPEDYDDENEDDDEIEDEGEDHIV